MKTIEKFMGKMMLAVSVLMSGMAVSCSSDEDFGVIDATKDATEEHTAVMHLAGSYPSFAGDETRAASTDWADGSVVYLRFYQADGETVVCGKAVYSSSAASWNVSYYGSLSEGSIYKCEAFYFTDVEAVDNYNINMTAMSCAYTDMDANYMIENNELFVNANLKPRTARMKIKGTANEEVTVSKVIYSKSFNLTNNVFVADTSFIYTKFDRTGYTPYIYCTLQEDGNISVDDLYYRYTKAFNPTKFAAGESGYIVMPSQKENKGWMFEPYYPESAVDMGCSVRWATTNVGADNEFDDGIYCSWGDATGTNTSGDSDYNRYVNEIAGNPEYDIATNKINDRWQIPTQEQWQELIDKCTWTYTYDGLRGVYGYTITAQNGNTIYLPMYDYQSWSSMSSDNSNTYGYYWTATPAYNDSQEAYNLYITTSSGMYLTTRYKLNGLQIRPVLVK